MEAKKSGEKDEEECGREQHPRRIDDTGTRECECVDDRSDECAERSEYESEDVPADRIIAVQGHKEVLHSDDEREAAVHVFDRRYDPMPIPCAPPRVPIAHESGNTA